MDDETAKATRPGIATQTEIPLNPNISSNTVAYDDDQIDEWGFLRQAVANLKAPDSQLADRRVFYGYVLENVKSPRSCVANPPSPAAEARKRTFISDDGTRTEAPRLPPALDPAGEYSADSNIGLVRIRIPELDALPPAPVTPTPADPAQQDLCKRSSAALQSATRAITSLYSLFSYKSNFEYQKFLVPGALVKVEYEHAPVTARQSGPASSPERPAKQTPYGVLRGAITSVVIHESGQPVLAFSAYQNKVQGSDAFGDAEKCKHLMAGAALGFGPDEAAAPMPAVTLATGKWFFGRPPTTEDIEYLARVIYKEGGLAKRDWKKHAPGTSTELMKELVAIGYVAMNRAKRTKKSIKAVVTALSFPGGKKTKTRDSRGELYVQDMQNPDFWVDHKVSRRQAGGTRYAGHIPAGSATREGIQKAFALALLSGQFNNPIDKRWHFVHPRGMKKCSDLGHVGKRTICIDTDKLKINKGLRRIPKWSISKSAGGSAQYEPIVINRAIFT